MSRLLLLVCLLALAGCSAPTVSLTPPSVTARPGPVVLTPSAETSNPPLTPAPSPRADAFGLSYLDVHYCSDGDMPLQLNLVMPNPPPPTPAPVLIHLKYQNDLLGDLVARGYIVVNVDWREPPSYKLPIGVQDVKCAIRFLRTHAADLHVDPDKIGLYGCSQGGHMAALVGLTDPSARMEGTYGFPDTSTRVKAFVMFDGIADFKTNYADAPDELAAVHGITSFDDPLVARLSPITYATHDAPPALLISSDVDSWYEQARELGDALKAAGSSVQVHRAAGAVHCQFSDVGPDSHAAMVKRIVRFFDAALHK